jgi:hypothetical protein
MKENEASVKERILLWISNLTDKQFAEFFYEAVANRNTSDVFEGHFLLADAEKVEDEPWSIDFIALQDSSQPIKYDDDYPICESGECTRCKSLVRSWAKRAICPICKTKVYCT